MKKAISRTLTAVLVIIAVLMLNSAVCYADGQSIILSKTKSVTNGSTFTIDIVTKGSWPKLVCYGPIKVQFDTAMFTYVDAAMVTGSGTFVKPDSSESAAGKLTVLCYGGSSFNVADGTKLVSLSFKAKNTGTGNISFLGTEGFLQESTMTELPVSTGSAITVTVTAPIVKSGNNNLKSLNIDPGSLSPAFTAGQTSYAAAVAEGVSKLTISAVPEDSKATVAVSGNANLQDGENKILVVVTAENGDKKTYTITATRAAPTPTPEPSPSPSPSPTPAVTVQLPDGPWTIMDPPAETVIPAGFYRTLTSVSGQMVPTFKAFKGDMILYWLSNSQTGKSGFYSYDSKTAAYQPLQVLTVPAHVFSVLSPEAGQKMPAGLTEADLILDGVTYKAWRPDPTGGLTAGSNDYLLYLMTGSGDKGFYWYNTATGILTAFQAPDSSGGDAVSPTAGESSPAPKPDQSTVSALNPWQLVAILLGVLCLILLGLVIWLTILTRRGGPGRPGRPSGDDGFDSWASLDDDDADDHDHRPPPVKAPPIRRVN